MSSEKTILGLLNLDPLQVGQRIKDIRGYRSQGKFGALLKVSQNAVKNYEKGRLPSAEMLEAIAKLDPSQRGARWLLTGESSKRNETGLVAESATAYEVLKVEELEQRLPGLEKTEISLMRVPILEDRIAAGPGRALDFSKIEDWARVPRWRLKRGNSYYMLRVTGDSMEHQLHAGDLILVNLTRRDPNRLKGKVVAAWLGDIEGATVKILEEDEQKRFWVLHPRNRLYKDIVIPKDHGEFQVAAVEAAWLNFE